MDCTEASKNLEAEVDLGEEKNGAGEFSSEVECLIPVEELDIPHPAAFGKYSDIMPPPSKNHPAKFNVELVERLIIRYTREGDTILDPLAGTGILGVIAALHGRNAVLVEIEEKYFAWITEALQNLKKLAPLTWVIAIRGDARHLSELLGGASADIVITSPPYVNTKPFHDFEFMKQIAEDQYTKRKSGVVKGHPGTPEAEKRRLTRIEAGIPENPKNISFLPYGRIDAVITSPPYLKSAERGGGINKQRPSDVKIGCSTIGRTDENPDAVDNLSEYGNLEALRSENGQVEALRAKLMTEGKPTYLSEMLKIYHEMFKVLRPGGLAAVIVRPFIREMKVVDLPYHTWILMSACGFKLENVIKVRLKRVSFWRNLYERRHPEIPKIRHEYVIVARKTS